METASERKSGGIKTYSTAPKGKGLTDQSKTVINNNKSNTPTPSDTQTHTNKSTSTQSHVLNICVVGGGVTGLTTAFDLLDEGYHVTIVSRDFITDTGTHHCATMSVRSNEHQHLVSIKAGGWWWPGEHYEDRIQDDAFDAYTAWATISHVVFCRIIKQHASTSGVQLLDGLRVFKRHVPDPWFKDIVQRYQRMDATHLASLAKSRGLSPNPYSECKTGYAFRSLFFDMSVYLPWLYAQTKQRGARFVLKEVKSLQTLTSQYDIVINCTGLGSRNLTGIRPDPSPVYPIAGQAVLVYAPQIKTFHGGNCDIDKGLPSWYIVPRTGGMVILGGTARKGDYSTEPRLDTARRILKDCARVEPSLNKYLAHVEASSSLSDYKQQSATPDKSKDDIFFMKHFVGLRPARLKGVRVEIEKGSNVIHNYGHAGHGVGLSWGCARNVVCLVYKLLSTIPRLKQKTSKHIVSKL